MSQGPATATPTRIAPHRATETLSVGVFGASGITGVELIRLLATHPRVRTAFATSRGEAGRPLDELDPAAPELRLVHPDDAGLAGVDVVFLCVPHGTAGPLARRCIEAGCRVIDVSGDHRLVSADAHAEHYGSERSEDLVRETVYGLTEHVRERLSDARLVACPGCYATASLLALVPLSRAGLLHDLAIIDAKSGVSGAGRSANATTHFCSAANDVQPYKLGRGHRHVAEIEQELTRCAPGETPARVIFNPHLVPLERGIEATIVLRGVELAQVQEPLTSAYADEPFVRVLTDGRTARIRAVAGTNRAVLSAHDVEGTDAVVVTCAIDNLLKGAAGQAVQNFNAMIGAPETTGLPNGGTR